MGAFEFEKPVKLSARNCGCNSNNNNNNNNNHHNHNGNINNGVNFDECNNRGEMSILAPRIFDQCRIQRCLTSADIGPARVAKSHRPNADGMCKEGDIIIPPINATDVTLRDFDLTSIEVLRKKASPIQDGCWDIDLKYTFNYFLEFRRNDGSLICVIEATNTYILKVTLFGSTQGDVTVISELAELCDNTQGKPCVYAEGKAVGLDASLKYPSSSCSCNSNCNSSCNCTDGTLSAPIAVDVTIGLFTIVKLYRTVSIVVESLGTIVPEPCSNGNNSTTHPCDNFNRIPFPLDLFVPNNETKSCCGYGDLYGSNDCEYDSDDDCGCNNGCDFDCHHHCPPPCPPPCPPHPPCPPPNSCC